MKNKNFLQIDYDLFNANLKTLEVLVYSYIKSWQKSNPKVFVSNARIAKDLGMGVGMIKEYIKRLESKGLLKRWTHNGTRYMKIFNIDSQNTDHSKQTDHTIDSKPTTSSQNTDHTIVSKLSRYNNNYKNINKNNYKPNLLLNKKTKDKFVGLIVTCSYKSGGDYVKLLSELTKEELKQVENYMKVNNKKDDYKESLLEVLQNKLYIKQKQI